MKKKTEMGKINRKSQFVDDILDSGKEEDGVLKPDDQLQLGDNELKEEITRILTANNPHAPHNIVRFNFKENQYKPIPKVEQMAIHFRLEGNMISKDSDEAKLQLAENGQLDIEQEAGESDETEEVAVESVIEEETVEQTANLKKKLVNQFNFCERATQTYNNPSRERGNATEPPSRGVYSANVTQWSIYDDYKEDCSKKSILTVKKSSQVKDEIKIKKKLNLAENQFDDITKFLQPIRIVERMVNQNTYDEVAQDFKYYEDASDEFRDSIGTLLPLWKFSYEKSKKLSVTSICWCPCYHDLFAVGLGSYDFLKQVTGMICFYTMKNPGYPEYIFETESGVLCLDLHTEFPYLLCVGFYDGAVGVYKLNQQKSTPLYLSTAKTGKHTDPVWEVRWQCNDQQTNLNFFSISADGRVTSWTLLKTGVGVMHECPNDMSCYDALIMQVVKDPTEDPESAQLSSYECGTAMDFHKSIVDMFLIATEEGMVHKCSKANSSEYLSSVKAHHMAVYKVSWNAYHQDIFITCSADWTVKIWSQHKYVPVFAFDLGAPVGDVAWAPYSSTVFAAVTVDGYCHVYDLSVNKYEALCKQLVVQKKKTKLTHVAFNLKYPIIICGDDRGQILCLKLSPNLRKKPKEKKGLEQIDPIAAEIEKLDKLLQLVG